MTQTFSCAVIGCSYPAPDATVRVVPEDSPRTVGRAQPVCSAHDSAIRNGARWIYSAPRGGILIGDDLAALPLLLVDQLRIVGSTIYGPQLGTVSTTITIDGRLAGTEEPHTISLALTRSVAEQIHSLSETLRELGA